MNIYTKLLKSGFVVALGLSLSFGVLADTIRLKDGSVIKGKITAFRDGQFFISVGDSARNRQRQMNFYADEIEVIEFNNDYGAPITNGGTNVSGNVPSVNNTNVSGSVPSVNNSNSSAPVATNNGTNNGTNGRDASGREVIVVGRGGNQRPSGGSVTQVINSQPVGSSSSDSGASVTVGANNSPRPTTTPVPTATPAATPTPSPTPVLQSTPATSTNSGTNRALSRFVVRVLADNTANGWTAVGSSNLKVVRGQRIRITATGRASLGNGRFSTPAGVSSLPDAQKLMKNDATGALIAVIGDNNDDFILIGSSREFVAQHEGTLFLGINEGNLDDNSGAYDVTVEIEN